MITINYLKSYPSTIPALADIWHQVLGRIWVPDVPIVRVEENLKHHLNIEQLPLTLVALDGDKPVGMCSLRDNDGIRPDLTPWLGSLVVHPNYPKQGIGRCLIDAIKRHATQMGFEVLYLFAFDARIPDYYQSLGWQKIGMDTFKGYPVTVMEITL